MAATADYYVDPGSGSDVTGTGTSGNPWASLQHALDTISKGSHGDQINLKAGTADTLSADLSLSTYGNPTYLAPLIIRGYTSSADDGGIGEIDLNGANNIAFSGVSRSGVILKDLEIHGSTDTVGVSIPKWSTVDNVYFHDMSNTALGIYENTLVCCSRFEDIGTYGVQTEGADGEHGNIIGNYFANGTKDFTAAIYCDNYSLTACRNIIYIDGTSDGIVVKFFGEVCHNSILSDGGSGQGIRCDTSGESLRIWSNLIEGFSTSGGIGIDYNSADQQMVVNNSAYNNLTDYGTAALHVSDDNESLGSSPFAKSGSATYANRFTYFSPNDVGNVRGGAYGNTTLDRGAVQHEATGGGGGNKVTRFIMGAM